MKTILVTGGAGYIGSVLVRKLLEANYTVRVIDYLSKGGESLLGLLDNPNFEFIKGDIRNQSDLERALKDVWGVCHLAAIVGDPACAKEPEKARSINLDASIQLYNLCNAHGVKKFIFSSTCSNYGKMSDPEGLVNEDSELAPVSLYAELKVSFEKYLLEQSRENQCKPTVLRFATVYGLSPRMRFDLTVNEFTKELTLGRELIVYGEQFWRPYCHVQDISNAVLTVQESQNEIVDFNVFNVGNTEENYTKKMIVDCILKEIPNGKIKYVKKDEDPRDYRVDFSKIANELGFKISRRVPDGIREVKSILENGFIVNPDDDKYRNS
jgi:nucleoside-diphosphate-sugar epimerase